MNIAGVIVVGIVAFLAALVAFMPATLVDRQLAAATAGKVRLADASGTVWSGRGVLTVPASTTQMPLAFSITKEDVARGMHRVALQPVDGRASPSGTVEVAGDGVRVRDLVVELPAATLAAAMPARGLAAFGGTIAIAAAIFDWTPSAKDGSVNARWRNARVVVADTIADLGTVELSAAARDGGLNGRLTNNGGDVRIDGTVIAGAGGAVSVDATVAPSASAAPNISRALAAIGTPDANGVVRITWRGAVR